MALMRKATKEVLVSIPLEMLVAYNVNFTCVKKSQFSF